MQSRSILTCVAVVCVSLVTGCGGPRWIVHSQAAPDPFVGQKTFAVAPLDFTGVRVGQKSEADYLAGKTPDQQASFAGDKASIGGEYMTALSSKAAAEGIQIVPAGSAGAQTAPLLRPAVYWIEPGYYVGVSSAPAQVKMILKIAGANGAPLDEIEVEGLGGGFSTTQRLSRAGSMIGSTTERYLRSRVTPGK